MAPNKSFSPQKLSLEDIIRRQEAVFGAKPNGSYIKNKQRGPEIVPVVGKRK
jgi:hypothetical protein